MRPTAARESPPRLILRFAVCTGILLALAAASILLVVRHFNTVQAERAATLQARLVAGSVLSGALGASDFEAPVTAERRAELDEFFAARVLDHGVLLVQLLSPGGTVTYSNDHRLIGTLVRERAYVDEALKGTVRGDVTTVARG